MTVSGTLIRQSRPSRTSETGTAGNPWAEGIVAVVEAVAEDCVPPLLAPPEALDDALADAPLLAAPDPSPEICSRICSRVPVAALPDVPPAESCRVPMFPCDGLAAAAGSVVLLGPALLDPP